MCLIAYTNDGSFLTQEELKATEHHNADGCGFMYLAGGRVRVRKSRGTLPVPHGVTEFAMHWRYSTSGKVTRKAAHPHFILNKDWGDDVDLAVMHNGVFSGDEFYPKHEDNLSDTQIWVRDILRPMLRINPEMYNATWSEFWDRVWDDVLVNSSSKVLFLHSELGFTSVPEMSRWDRSRDGIVVSNTYSLAPAPRYKYTPITSLPPYNSGYVNVAGTTVARPNYTPPLNRWWDDDPYYTGAWEHTEDDASIEDVNGTEVNEPAMWKDYEFLTDDEVRRLELRKLLKDAFKARKAG